MASRSLDDLTPDTRAVAFRLIEIAKENGIDLRVVSTLRTCDDQNAIYNQGRTTPGPIISGASGCRSWHVWGRALDVMVVDDDGKLVTNGRDPRYDQLGDIGRNLGMIWGGNFSWGRDAVHFEYHPNLTINDICPDRSPDRCQEQISIHNSQNTQSPPHIVPLPPNMQYVPIGTQERVSKGIDFWSLFTSAFIGAMAFQLANKLITKSTRR